MYATYEECRAAWLKQMAEEEKQRMIKHQLEMMKHKKKAKKKKRKK